MDTNIDTKYQNIYDLYKNNRNISKYNNYNCYITGNSLLNTPDNIKLNNNKKIFNLIKELNNLKKIS